MKQKQIVACMDAQGKQTKQIIEEAIQYEGSGADALLVVHYSEAEQEREQFILTLRELTKAVDVPVYAGCYVARLEDVKKLYYAGAKKVVLDSAYLAEEKLIAEAVTKIGKEAVFVQKQYGGETHIYLPDAKEEVDSLVFGRNLQEIEAALRERSMETEVPESVIPFENLKQGEDGLVPVIVQDYKTNEVLMLAYMNEEAFNCTIRTGKMTYYSRSRHELWIKGATSGHYQYVKSLSVDCDKDTLLAKVKQIGVACHTGNRSCFYRDMIVGEWEKEDNTGILEKVYATVMDRKINPKEGSYTNYLFDKGIDKILKKCGEEATEIVIAAKNPDKSEIKYEIADFLYHVTVLMAECNLDWKDVFEELANRD